ncbi:MAG: glycerol-3-phosphate 1-O-acyltransferase PlsY [Pseudomonadota bacterium]
MPDPISWAADWPFYAMTFALAYLSGSIPFGLILTKAAGLGDVRKIGSGNIGATNVLRTGRKDIAFATVMLDGLKGTVPVLAAFQFGGPDQAVTAALAALLGHLFPVWLGFRGGKGVATYIGCLAGCSLYAGLGFGAVWLAMAFTLRFSSAASLTATFATPFILVAFNQIQYAEVFGLMTALIWYKHTPNIQRLLSGTESKIGKKS